MAGNSFGTLFRFTTWGESHGPAIGVVVDGVPPKIPLAEADIQHWLDRRRPGQSRYTTQRQEPDQVKILSGTFEGLTTGTPIHLSIDNVDRRPRAVALAQPARRQQEHSTEREIDDSEHPAEQVEAAEDGGRPAAGLARRLESRSAGKDKKTECPYRECRASAPQKPQENHDAERGTQPTGKGSEDHDNDPSEVVRLLGVLFE